MKHLLFCLCVLFPLLGFSQQEEERMCGVPPGFLTKLLTNASEIRQKCLEQMEKDHQEKVQKELKMLYQEQKNLQNELKTVAYKVVNNEAVYCIAPGSYNPKLPKSQKEARCDEIVQLLIVIHKRIFTLMGWNQNRPVINGATDIKNQDIAPPCPSQRDLEDIKKVRYFNKELYQTWERCVVLQE